MQSRVTNQNISGLAVALYAMLALVGVVILGCSQAKSPESTDGAPVADSLKSSARPDQESEDASIFLYEGRRKSTHILADHIWKYSQRDSVIARGLQVDFFDTTGRVSAHLISDSGLILETKHLMIAIGNVEVINADSNHLYTEELHWNNHTGKITSDKYVTIISQKDTLRGYGFETDREMKRVKILRQVEGAFNEPPGGSKR